MDTATETLAVAIGEGSEMIACSSFRVLRGHSRILQPTISHLLQHTGIHIDNITGIGVGIGPGSYTGVRLAVSTAKAMATTLSVPLYPVPTLFGIAEAARPGFPNRPSILLPMLFARRGRAFGAIYFKNTDGSYSTIKSSKVMPVLDWCKEAQTIQADSGADLIVIHDFLPKHGVLGTLDILQHRSVMTLQSVSAALGPSFLHLVAAGAVSSVTGEEVHSVVPEYALEVEAETKLRERRQGVHE